MIEKETLKTLSKIITSTPSGIFFALEAANVKSPKASIDSLNIIRLVGALCRGVLVKDYAIYKKWIKM